MAAIKVKPEEVYAYRASFGMVEGKNGPRPKISQNEMGRRFGVDPSTFHRWEGKGIVGASATLARIYMAQNPAPAAEGDC